MSTRSIDRKLSRARDHRRLLIRTLATQLVMQKSITTSLPRAKALVPYIERITARAQRGDLHARRYVRSRVDTVEAAHELIDVIGAQTKRQGGYVRLKKAGFRSGDNTPLATVSFVDTFNKEAAAPKQAQTTGSGQKKAVKPTVAATKAKSSAKKAQKDKA